MASVQAPLTDIDPELMAMPKKAQIHADVIAKFKALGCFTVAHFANWVEDRGGVHSVFLADVDSCKNDGGQLARVKMVWREADALYAKRLKRSSDGLLEADIDQPLDEGTQESIEQAFRDKYSWPTLAPDKIGTDTLLGRIHREFVGWKPSMFPVAKARSLKMAVKGTGRAKRQCGAGVSVVIDGEDDEESLDIRFFYEYVDELTVLSNTWALGFV